MFAAHILSRLRYYIDPSLPPPPPSEYQTIERADAIIALAFGRDTWTENDLMYGVPRCMLSGQSKPDIVFEALSRIGFNPGLANRVLAARVRRETETLFRQDRSLPVFMQWEIGAALWGNRENHHWLQSDDVRNALHVIWPPSTTRLTSQAILLRAKMSPWPFSQPLIIASPPHLYRALRLAKKVFGRYSYALPDIVLPHWAFSESSTKTQCVSRDAWCRYERLARIYDTFTVY